MAFNVFDIAFIFTRMHYNYYFLFFFVPVIFAQNVEMVQVSRNEYSLDIAVASTY